MLYYRIQICMQFAFFNPCITFDSVESATETKVRLNGRDVYSGCCTLKIEFARVCVHD